MHITIYTIEKKLTFNTKQLINGRKFINSAIPHIQFTKLIIYSFVNNKFADDIIYIIKWTEFFIIHIFDILNA